MSYPRNAASPERVDIGPVIQISDGAVQTAGVAVKVIPFGGTEAAGAGAVAYSADGVVLYTPTQGETNYTSFILVASKTGCIPASKTVVTSASGTAGYAGLDWSKITAATTTVALTGTTISTSQVVASVSGSVGSVTGAVGSVTAAVTVGTNNDKTGYSLTAGTGLGNQTANITGSLSGSVGSVTNRVTANADQWGGVTVTGMPLPATGYTSPLNAAGTASAVWDALLATYTASGSFGARVMRLDAASSGNGAKVTGAGHVAADLHELQPGVITAADFAANWLTAAGTAADYITELQTAIGTAANQTAILDRQGYTLAVLAGTISDAQTAAETYAITLNGNTFTVDYSGLDASGNRGATTLTKA